MDEDPIVAEVRAAREAYAARFNFDLDAICKDLRRGQSTSGHKVVSFPPRLIESVESEESKEIETAHA